VCAQGDVESIASKSPKELTALIESISGSDQLNEEYDRLADEKNKAEENTIFNFQKRKGISAEKKQYKEQKEEAERFNDLVKQQVCGLFSSPSIHACVPSHR
jgi:structural maintenance of chromosome 1